MKRPNKLLRAVPALLIAIFFMSFSAPTRSIFGEWTGTDKSGKSASFIFEKTHHLVMIMSGERMDGHKHDVNGHEVEIKYEVDETKSPMWLDFAFYKDGEKLKDKTIKGIFRYLSDNKIELRMDFDTGKRFERFDADDKDNTIVMTRKD
jgi:hypothetical protein